LAETAPAPSELQFSNAAHFRELLGNHDEHIRLVERETGVRIDVGEQRLTFHGDAVETELARRVLGQLYALLEQGYPIYASDVDYAVRILSGDRGANLRDIFLDTVFIAANKRVITPKSLGQKAYIDAIRNFDVVFGIGPAGTGKCVAGSTLVPTDRGLLPIVSIADGTKSGEYRAIGLLIAGRSDLEPASHVYNGGRSRTRRITTRLGYEIEVTPEHPLLRLEEHGVAGWAPAEDLRVGDYVAIRRGQELFGRETRINWEYESNTHRDHSKPIAVGQLDPELAYLLGVLTGDGCLTARNRIILTSADDDIVGALRRFAERNGLHVFRNGDRPYDYVIASSQLYQLLICLGLSAGCASTKRIPAAVLRAPRAIVKAFMQGLFDADGTVERRGGYPSLLSASKQLIDEVQQVLLNFGILASKRAREVEYDGRLLTYYEVEIRSAHAECFYEEIGFRLSRKQSLQKAKPRNTNVDLVPHVATLIDAAARTVVLSRAAHKRIYDYRIARRQPSQAKLGEILELLTAAATGEMYKRLEVLRDGRIFWAKITDIEESEADVYDLTVPGSHSFCANGFVNHNTYLAMAMAVAELMKNSIARIVLTRPAVEAGEKLGFLPGDLAEKVNPYLRPLYDALNDMVDFDRARRLVERGTIEVAPLAFMRGRTLNDCFVILDEAQNTTTEQMKMFLTRLGYGSKAVITGDITQVDLPAGKASGLREAAGILRGIDGIRFVKFTERDVVRHPLVQEIISAYERAST
jgi:phosphate starvation-inducible protein PhoH/intein/homing endonuclease